MKYDGARVKIDVKSHEKRQISLKIFYLKPYPIIMTAALKFNYYYYYYYYFYYNFNY